MDFPELPARFLDAADDFFPAMLTTVLNCYENEPQVLKAVTFLLFSHFKQSVGVTLMWLWAMAVCSQRQKFIFTAANEALWQFRQAHPRVRDTLDYQRDWSRILWTRKEDFWIRYVQAMKKRLNQMLRTPSPMTLPFSDSVPCVQCASFTITICPSCIAGVCTRCVNANSRLVNPADRCLEWNHFNQDLY